MKKYKKRWFVLQENSFILQYFSSSSSSDTSKPLGQIDINHILNVIPLENSKKHLFGMYITTHSRPISLYARTLAERDAWCGCLSHRLIIIANNKFAAREPQILHDEDSDRNCQTFPKVAVHPYYNHRDVHRESPRRALSDGMLNGRFTRATPTSPLAPITMTALSHHEVIGSCPVSVEDNSVNSSPMITPRSPITISDENARFHADNPKSNLGASSVTPADDDPSPDTSMALDEPSTTHNSKLTAKVGRLEHIVEEKDATIAALNAMLKRQSMVSAPLPAGKNRYQQQFDELINIGLWLEQKKKTDMEKDVQQLKEANAELGTLLEEERQKSQALERDRYNMQCMIEHLEREKRKT